jgi:hypothetical protein
MPERATNPEHHEPHGDFLEPLDINRGRILKIQRKRRRKESSRRMTTRKNSGNERSNLLFL